MQAKVNLCEVLQLDRLHVVQEAVAVMVRN